MTSNFTIAVMSRRIMLIESSIKIASDECRMLKRQLVSLIEHADDRMTFNEIETERERRRHLQGHA